MLSTTTSQNLLEVVDIKNRPLGVLPESQVHFHGLHHRSLAVAVYDRQGRIYIQKRTESEPPYCGKWDLPASGHVLAGEAVQEAASRELRERTGLKLAGFRLVSLVDGRQETNYEFVYVYNAGRIRKLPVSSPEKTREGLFMDTRGMSLLVHEHPETMTPRLIYLWKLELLFC